MKQRIKKGLLYLALGFVGLFGLRLAYGYVASTGLLAQSALSDALITSQGGRTNLFEFAKSNYASEKLKIERGSADAYSVDQKYEKIASLAAASKAFDDDEARIREAAKRFSALIQYEQSSGMKGNRKVNLAIGVPPQLFDPMVAELKEVGDLTSIHIDKVDKTNEYKELNAKRASLEKARGALTALKSKGGNIEEFTNLENRILELEEEIQSTGVKLGDYSTDNEFCTIKLSLAEKALAAATIPFRHRAAVALVWSIQTYAMLLMIVLLGTLVTLLVVIVLQRLNILPPPLTPQTA
jgi:hypothetical protein